LSLKNIEVSQDFTLESHSSFVGAFLKLKALLTGAIVICCPTSYHFSQ
jgi:hypothetical protein